jgi:deazaflavin-dependent oxidoreductase (nitroreductase family)
MVEQKNPRNFGTVERAVQKVVTKGHEVVVKATGGRVGGRIAGMDVLVLHTVGRKSGLPRTTPLTYMNDDENLILVASNGGARNHPTWFLNLTAEPNVEVERKGKKEKWTARRATKEEKERLWPKITSTYKGYASYQKRTDRDIPVVILERS